MKILHIGSGNLFGGVEKVLLTLSRLRHLCPILEQHFAVSFRGRLEDELRETGAPVHALEGMRGRDPMAILRNRRTLARLASELKFEAIVYHSLWSYDLLSVGARRTGASGVLWLHDAVTHIGPLERVAALQRPELVLSNSQFTAGTASVLYPKAPVRVVYCPVEFTPLRRDLSQKKAMRDSLATGLDSIVIVQASRLEAWKGHVLHLEALANLRDLPNWVLWIAGSAQRREEQKYLNSLHTRAALLGIADRIRFLGHRSDVGDVLGAADIHCQPNQGPEPFGIASVEAMMAGLPLVGCRLGAACELIDSSCGLLCEPGDVSGLAAILRLLVADRELRERLGKNGPSRARQISDPATRMSDLARYLREAVRVDRPVAAISAVAR